MALRVQHFLLIIVVIIFSLFYITFSDYYRAQQYQTADVILSGLNKDMGELSYILSKDLGNKEDIYKSRAILDRIAAGNDFISSIMVLDNTEMMITTDPINRKVPDQNFFYTGDAKTSYQKLSNMRGLQGETRYFEGQERKSLTLIMYLDRANVLKVIEGDEVAFLLYFAILPGLVILIMWIGLQILLTKPLEKLRQYAYYHNEIPSQFKIKELESIRSSMLQTFTRLEREQKELYKAARTDELSGLGNRNSLNEFLNRLIENAGRHNEEFAVLFLDLDHFKNVNDSLGHPIGDELLQNVAASIAELVRTNDFVARVGGDEFIVILQQYHSLSELTQIIQRIRARIQQHWIIQSHPIHVTSSIGVAFYPKDGTDSVSLIKHSDIAMFEAKKEGRNRYHFFTDALNEKVQETILLDRAMREALGEEQFELYYQPKISLQNGSIDGAEALIRWRKSDGGIVPPNEFIPLAEENGFIVELGLWVFKTAVQQQVSWSAQNIDLPISINLSIKQLMDANFKTQMLEIFEQTQADPTKIEIEITEYLFLEQNLISFETLKVMHDMGIRLALDDFGTGYSSLSYLKRFDIDVLKIDKAFVDDFDTEDGAIFLETIVKMGQTLRMEVIAEGVESKEQVNYLRKIGCNMFQGYYGSKPLNVLEFESFYLNFSPQV